MSDKMPTHKTRIVVELLANSEQDIDILEFNYRALTAVMQQNGVPARMTAERFVRDVAAEKKAEETKAGKGANPLN